MQKFGTLPSEQARSIVSVGLLACQWEVVQNPLRHMTADRNREKFNRHLSQWRVLLYVVLRFSAKRDRGQSLVYHSCGISHPTCS